MHNEYKIVKLIKAEWIGGCQGLGRGRNWKILAKKHSFNYVRCKTPRYLLWSSVLIVDNTVLHAFKFVKRIDFMLSVLMTKENNK